MKRNIAKSELDVMSILWDRPGLAASAVHAGLSDTDTRSLQTIKTLLSRLVDKGALQTEAEGRRYLYHPTMTRDDYAASATRRFSDRLFGGRAAPIVAHLAEDNGLSNDDIAELEAIIRELKSRD
ncbi:BlaI/MecI/CopY family transcriptional regulator [uncultured Algimonas sp.]|uniref:BlaI/MecI/CopY family transcriptional regulator n=1 Tax=uncultured Algimonas sp. TaxID=1547920 RepID=UPI00260D8604|nr:BlaI/MecI/CopY family transcriptional regulator [uncultured Algimonas sp.]